MLEDIDVDFQSITGRLTCTDPRDTGSWASDNVNGCIRTSEPVELQMGDTLRWPAAWPWHWANEDDYAVTLRFEELWSAQLWLEHRLTDFEVGDLFMCSVSEPVYEGKVWEEGRSRGVVVVTAYRTGDGRYRIVLNNTRRAGAC